jgi:hypothetical protein
LEYVYNYRDLTFQFRAYEYDLSHLLVKRKNLSKLEIKYNENNSRDSCPLFHTISCKINAGPWRKTVILRTYEAAVHTYLFDDVLYGF